MKNVLSVKRAALVILALLLLSTMVIYAQQTEDRYLIVTEEGEFKKEVDVTGWEPGEEFVYLMSGFVKFYYPWQGEDSLDYRIEDGLLWVNDKLIGANLEEVAFADLSNPEEILTVIRVERQHMPELKRFPNLTAVRVSSEIDDADLKHLAGLTNLRVLDLGATDITDAGLGHLSGLTNLRVLDLKDTDITDAGLAHLKGLKNLRELYLGWTKITGAGLRHLKGLTNLRVWDLSRTPITDAGLVHL
ncbi:MAG: hypothetical protein E3J71_07280, partial [Candidatus Stahlbacteria bacterium]